MDATFRDILYFFVVDVRMRVKMLASLVRFRVAVRLNSFFFFHLLDAASSVHSKSDSDVIRYRVQRSSD